jgi:hypothetical protein
MEEKINEIVGNTKRLKPEKISFRDSILIPFSIEWLNFFRLLFNPWFFFLLIIIVLIFLFSYLTVSDKKIVLVLNIVASIFTAFAGSIIYDRYKEITGNTILVKKGRGAVRSLFLIVEKVKNVSERLEKGASNTEAINILGLLEKDIVLATQEWTDVIPGLVDVELYSNIIKEKELERDEKEFQYNEVKQELDTAKEALNIKQAKEAADASKITELQKKAEELLKLLNQRNEQISELKMIRDVAISRSTNTSTNTAYGVVGGIISGSSSATNVVAGKSGMGYGMKLNDINQSGYAGNMSICKNCHALYARQAIGDDGYCTSCAKYFLV